MISKNFAVIGYPLKFTLSPIIHNYWYNKYNINACYTKLPLNPDNTNENLAKQVAEMQLTGFNITVPFKQLFYNIVDQVDEISYKIKGINTVKIENHKLYGFNTDYLGFIANLEQYNFNPHSKTALIMGAGGASLAVIHALLDLGVGKIIIANRTTSKIQKIAQIAPLIIESYQNHLLNKLDIIINTTSLNTLNGLPVKIDFNQLKNSCLIYDVVYQTIDTELVKSAIDHNLKFIPGIELLLSQAQNAFKVWFGFLPAIDPDLRQLLSDLSSH